MGGGPLNEMDIVKSTCILTFPRETNIEPVPLDAKYLHTLGLRMIKRLVREFMGKHVQVCLLMHSQMKQLEKRTVEEYVIVADDRMLRRYIEQIFRTPELILTLHLVPLEQTQKHIQIRIAPSSDPNFSPEVVNNSATSHTNSLQQQHRKSITLKDVIFPRLSIDKCSGSSTGGRNVDKEVRANHSSQKDSEKMVDAVDMLEYKKKKNYDSSMDLQGAGSASSNNSILDLSSSMSNSEDRSGVRVGSIIRYSNSKYFIASSWHLQADQMSSSQILRQSTSSDTERDKVKLNLRNEKQQETEKSMWLEDSFVFLPNLE